MNNHSLNPEEEHDFISWQKRQKRGKIAAGILIVAFGVVYLLNEIGIVIPKCFFSWQIFLMGLVIVLLVKHRFAKGWIVLGIGTAFLMNEIYPNSINTNLIWPSIIIAFGLGLIFKRHKHKKCDNRWKKYKHFNQENFKEYSEDEFIESTAIFGGVTKNIVTKNFKGANVTNVFGGTELNLLNVEFEQQAIIEISCVFGGLSLIIPSNWQVKSELNSIFGGIEDKRIMNPNEEVDSKILILKGDCIFGGIDIKSFK
jgi:predicted membrane protein